MNEVWGLLLMSVERLMAEVKSLGVMDSKLSLGLQLR